ncbi:MAG: pilin [Minisyncoccia bacterium]
MKKILVSSLGLVAFAPVLAFAAINSLYGLMGFVTDVVRWAGPTLGAIAILYFIWQVIQYTVAGDEDKKKEAKNGIIWAVVGIFVIFSVWGLVGILQNTFAGQGSVGTIQLPY